MGSESRSLVLDTGSLRWLSDRWVYESAVNGRAVQVADINLEVSCTDSV